MTCEEHVNELKRVIASLEKEIAEARSDNLRLINMLEDYQQIFIEHMREKYNEI